MIHSSAMIMRLGHLLIVSEYFCLASTTTKNEDDAAENDLCKQLKSLEERRRSLLDHHWAIPKKDSKSIDDDSIDDTVGGDAASTSIDADTSVNSVGAAISQLSVSGDHEQLSKENCHDSGIDIRDPNAILPPISTKKHNYSDADIVLSSDWTPPITIAPTEITGSPAQSTVSGLNAPEPVARKKTSSVSFSVDDNSENHSSGSSDRSTDNNNKKNKMLKRLSYPLTWVEGLTGEGKPESTESAPNTGDSNQSVFSKVFSRWVRMQKCEMRYIHSLRNCLQFRFES